MSQVLYWGAWLEVCVAFPTFLIWQSVILVKDRRAARRQQKVIIATLLPKLGCKIWIGNEP